MGGDPAPWPVSRNRRVDKGRPESMGPWGQEVDSRPWRDDGEPAARAGALCRSAVTGANMPQQASGMCKPDSSQARGCPGLLNMALRDGDRLVWQRGRGQQEAGTSPTYNHCPPAPEPQRPGLLRERLCPCCGCTSARPRPAPGSGTPGLVCGGSRVGSWVSAPPRDSSPGGPGFVSRDTARQCTGNAPERCTHPWKSK